MKKKILKSKKLLAVVLSLVIVATMGIAVSIGYSSKESQASRRSKDIVVNILHTNDMHADIEMLSYVAKFKTKTCNPILVDAGDASQGKPLATYTKGTSIIDLMNMAKYDVSAVGNHEFDYGKEQLVKNVDRAKYPYVAANIIDKTTGKAYLNGINRNNGAYTIIQRGGKRIGFFGITTTETAYKTNPKNVEGLLFEEEIRTAQKAADELNKVNCDLVVGLCHVGNDKETKPTSLQIAEALNGVDLIIDGHSHTEIQQEASNGTVVVQTGTQLNKLGMVTVTFGNVDTYINTKLLTKEEYQKFGKSKRIENEYKKLVKKLEPVLNHVVGKTDTDLIANEENENGESIRICRNRETSMGDLVADATLWGAKDILKTTEYKDLPTVAMQNGGGVRANIKAGNITIGDVYNVLPFGNTLSVKIVTPEILYKTLEYSISQLALDKEGKVAGLVGSYPQIAGMRFEMDLKKSPYVEGKSNGERILAVYLVKDDGTEVKLDRKDNKTEIAFASNNFLIAGGDGFSMLTNLKNVSEGNVLDEIMADYVEELTTKAGGCFTYKMPGNRSVEVNSKK